MKNCFLKWCFILAACSICWEGIAQQNAIDSLLAVLEVSRTDTNRINTLNQLGQKLCRAKQYSEAMKFALEADSLSVVLSFLKGRAESNNNIGCTCLSQKLYEEASLYFKKALSFSENEHNAVSGRSYFNLGLVDRRKQNWGNAIEYFNKSLTIRTELKDSSGMADCYNNIGWAYLQQNDFEKGIFYCQLAANMCEQIGNYKGVGDAYAYIAKANENQADLHNALTLYLKSLEAMQKYGDANLIGMAQYNLAVLFSSRGEYEEGLKYYQAAIPQFRNAGNQIQLAFSYKGIGDVYSYQDNRKNAMANYEVAVKLQEENNDFEGKVRTYSNMSVLLMRDGDYPEAIDLLLKSLKIAKEIGDELVAGYLSLNIGDVYFLIYDYDEALKYFKAALEISGQLEDKKLILIANRNIGRVNKVWGKSDEAISYFRISLQISEAAGIKEEMFNDYLTLGDFYVELDQHSEALKYFEKAISLSRELDKSKELSLEQLLGTIYMESGEYSKAREHLEKFLELSKLLGSKDLLRNAHRNLAKLDSLQQDYKSAYHHTQMYALYKDSLLNETNLKQIAELKEKFETEKKDKEIIRLESDRQINLLLIQTKSDSLIIAAAEKHRLQLEKDRIHALQQASQHEIALMTTERKLQSLEIDKKHADYLAEKAANDNNKSELAMMSQEARIKELELRKSQLAKNVLLGGLVLFCLLGWFVYSNYTTRQQLKLQQLRNKIASDLHDDIGSTLSSISIFSDMVKLQSKEVNPMLETIGESSKKMLDAMGDIVWTINPENDDFEKILVRMRSFAYELLGAKKIDFAFDTDERLLELKVPMEVRKNLFLIFKEATNNLVKYSQADLAQFRISEANNRITMTILDNGRGFDENANSQGNGLKNMKKRAAEIGGNLYIQSKRDEGTMIQFSVAV